MSGEIVHISREIAEARAEVERARTELESQAVALRERVSRGFDWREWVRRNPTLVLGTALAAGFLLGFRPSKEDR